MALPPSPDSFNADSLRVFNDPVSFGKALEELRDKEGDGFMLWGRLAVKVTSRGSLLLRTGDWIAELKEQSSPEACVEFAKELQRRGISPHELSTLVQAIKEVQTLTASSARQKHLSQPPGQAPSDTMSQG